MQNLISVPYTLLSEKTQRSPESESGPFKLDPGAYEEMVQHQLSFHVPRGLFKIETRDSAGARLGKAAMSLSCCGGPRSRSPSPSPLRIRRGNCDVRNGAAQFQLYVECVVEYVMYVFKLYECLYTSKTRTMYSSLVKHEACTSSFFALSLRLEPSLSLRLVAALAWTASLGDMAAAAQLAQPA